MGPVVAAGLTLNFGIKLPYRGETVRDRRCCRLDTIMWSKTAVSWDD